MRYVTPSAAAERQVSSDCVVTNYGSNQGTEIEVIHLDGRYPPDQEFLTLEDTEVAIVCVTGIGMVRSRSGSHELSSGHSVFIEPDEPFALEGEDMKVFLTYTPPRSY